MAKPLQDKVALVTGASSGIGEETAKQLAAAGAKVAVAARRRDRLEALAQEIEGSGGTVLIIEADFTDQEAIKSAFAEVKSEFGRLDILINNAGVMLLGPVRETDPGDWAKMINLNLLGLIWSTRAGLDLMGDNGGGDIVNISSVAGRTTRPTSAVYNATKWGVNAFTDALRQELAGTQIRTTLIEPGAVATELQSHITHEQSRRNTEEMIKNMRPLQSEDIARAILYAVSQPPHVAINEMLIRPTDQPG